MSASITTAPARASFGRFSLAIALMALAVVIAAAVALVALNGTKTAAPTTGAATQYGQSVTNVPFYDHGWSEASTSAATKAYANFGPYYYNGYDSYTPSTGTGYPPFGATYAPSTSVGYPLSGASYFPVRIQAIDEGARGDRVIEPQYVAPRPRNQ